jgi:hypothetical protein
MQVSVQAIAIDTRFFQATVQAINCTIIYNIVRYGMSSLPTTSTTRPIALSIEKSIHKIICKQDKLMLFYRRYNASQWLLLLSNLLNTFPEKQK